MLLKMTLNGEPVSVEIEPDDLLAQVLRERLGLIGTKIACGEGNRLTAHMGTSSSGAQEFRGTQGDSGELGELGGIQGRLRCC